MIALLRFYLRCGLLKLLKYVACLFHGGKGGANRA